MRIQLRKLIKSIIQNPNRRTETVMKNLLKSSMIPAIFVASALAAAPAIAADKYEFDASHSQVIFSYDHLGYSTTYGMFSGFNGEAMLDMDDLSKSSVSLEISIDEIITGWDQRSGHFKSADLFKAADFPVATFVSTSVEPTGEKTAKITGDLTIAGTTKSVVLDTVLNKVGKHPQSNKDWAGFNATTTLIRSEFGMGMAAPFVGDEVNIVISVEMGKADG